MTDAGSPVPSRAATVHDMFVARFGREPQVIASAPGRVNLIGEHTDYNGGEVLPIAINRRTWVAVGDRGDGEPRLRAASSSENSVVEVPLPGDERQGNWSDYLTGVIGPLCAQALARGMPARSVDIAVTSDVPVGAGLSSSAALEVATGLATASLLQIPLTLRQAAMAAWRAETAFVGVRCGIMDQFASALCQPGEALHIDCGTTLTSGAPFHDSVLVFDTAVRRGLRDSAFNARRAECADALRLLQSQWPALMSLADAEPEQVLDAPLPEPLGDRALHVSRETRRVREAVSLLRAGQSLTRELLVGSHESLRDLYDCSSPELDWVVTEAMKLDGVRGARMTGAGWGGCAVIVGDEAALEGAAPMLVRDYAAAFGLEPRAWLTRASAGGRLERQ